MGFGQRRDGERFFSVLGEEGAFWLYLGEYRGVPRVRPLALWLRERHRKEIERTSWRVYVAEAMRGLLGGEGQSWWDVIHPEPIDTRTGDEVAAYVFERTGIRLAQGGEGE